MINEEEQRGNLTGVEKAKKAGSKTPYVVTIVCLAILALAGTGFGVAGMISSARKAEEFADLEKKVGGSEKNGESETGDDGEIRLKIKDLAVRGDKVIESEGPMNYALTSEFGNGALKVMLTNRTKGTVADCDTGERQAEDESKLTAIIDYDLVKDWYGLDGTKTGTEEVEITGVKADDVVDVIVAGFGNGVGGSEAILMQMKDGTVEYIPIKKALSEGFHSFGKIEGVEDIVRIRSVMASYECSGGLEAIAQKANGEIYELYPILAMQGAWD